MLSELGKSNYSVYSPKFRDEFPFPTGKTKSIAYPFTPSNNQTNENLTCSWVKSNFGIKCMKVYLDITFFTLSLPLRIRWNDATQRWEVYEILLQKLLCFTILLATIPYMFNPAFLNKSENGSGGSGEYDKSFSVLDLFKLGKQIIYPIYGLTWIYTVTRIKSHISHLLHFYNGQRPMWDTSGNQDYGIRADYSESSTGKLLLEKVKVSAIYVFLFGIMSSGMSLDMKWTNCCPSIHEMSARFWMMLGKTPEDKDGQAIVDEPSIMIKVLSSSFYVAELYKSWSYHITAINMTLVSSLLLQRACSDFKVSLEESQNAELTYAYMNYLELRSLSEQINGMVGPMMAVNAIGSIPFFASLISSFPTRNYWYSLKDFYSATVLCSTFLIGSDAHAKVLDVRDWILTQSSSIHFLQGKTSPLIKQARESKGSHLEDNQHARIAYYNLLHNDISTSTIALKGLSFFTINYNFMGHYFGHCLTFAIIALQSQSTPESAS